MGMDSGPTRRLSAMFAAADKVVGAGVQRVVRKAAKDIQRDAKILAPYEFGTLRNSITTSDLRSVGHGDSSVEIGPTVNYGYFQEYGTSRMPPQAYMNPAADRNEPAFMQALEQLGMEALGG